MNYNAAFTILLIMLLLTIAYITTAVIEDKNRYNNAKDYCMSINKLALKVSNSDDIICVDGIEFKEVLK